MRGPAHAVPLPPGRLRDDDPVRAIRQRVELWATCVPPLRREFRAELLAGLSADIDDLADLLGRKLDRRKA
jgi:hypothetical protein